MPTIYTDITKLKADLQAHPDKLPGNVVDDLAYTAQLGATGALKEATQEAIRSYASAQGIYAASIHSLYMAFASGEVSGFTVPALNVRTLTYDFACMIFQTMLHENIGPVIFEIASSEQEYTSQTHAEFASSILAGALKAGYTGPVFLQGDHYQFRAEAFRKDKESELQRIQEVIRTALAAQFYNIDIDGSTLVNLELPYQTDQQKDNFEVTAHISKFIRQHQPEGITVSIGGEIGHIGGVNSSPEDLQAFLDGYRKIHSADLPGLSKIAIQTGTRHGGDPQADGTLAPFKLNAELHKTIGDLARTYGVGGTVQHGASTLPEDVFHILPEMSALEVHLATGWQNIIFETMSEERREAIHTWVEENLQKERDTSMSDQQFVYKTRKKALGHFKEELWMMDSQEKDHMLDVCAQTFARICKELRVCNTRDTLLNYIHE